MRYAIARNHIQTSSALFDVPDAIVSVDDCKNHLRLYDDDDDAYIGNLRDNAAAEIELLTGQSLTAQTFIAEVVNEPCDYDAVRIDRSNIISITSLEVLDKNGEDFISLDATQVEAAKYSQHKINRIMELRRTDDCIFRGDRDISAKITYTRAIRSGTNDALIFKALVMEYVKSAYLYGAEYVQGTIMTHNAAYARRVKLLTDRRSATKWTS